MFYVVQSLKCKLFVIVSCVQMLTHCFAEHHSNPNENKSLSHVEETKSISLFF